MLTEKSYWYCIRLLCGLTQTAERIHHITIVAFFLRFILFNCSVAFVIYLLQLNICTFGKGITTPHKTVFQSLARVRLEQCSAQ